MAENIVWQSHKIGKTEVQYLEAALVAERQHCHLIAISAQAAKAAGTGWASCQWPDQPDSDAMLHLAAPLCRSA